MILKIRDFIRRMQIVSAQQIAREFHVDEQALQPMLAVWINKKVIQLYQEKSACSSCLGCKKQKTPVFYQYIRYDNEY